MKPVSTAGDPISTAAVDGDALILNIRGEIDLHNSPELRTELFDLLNRHRPRRLVIDLSQVPYMDSSALAVFVETLRRVGKAGGRLFLAGLQPRVRGLLEIARLNSIFVLCADTAEALAK